jgi:hypothetical protein
MPTDVEDSRDGVCASGVHVWIVTACIKLLISLLVLIQKMDLHAI